MMDRNLVVLVNEQDEEIGTMEKMEAHRKGLLHRAFSVFIFDKEGRMLLQQRAERKYHGANLWTNACCSHPLPGEKVEAAALRRLKEELGFETEVNKIFHFIYNEAVENGLTEHEYDHVFTGMYNNEIFNPDPAEVNELKFMQMEAIRNNLLNQPSAFTTWFRISFPKIEQWHLTQFKKANSQ